MKSARNTSMTRKHMPLNECHQPFRGPWWYLIVISLLHILGVEDNCSTLQSLQIPASFNQSSFTTSLDPVGEAAPFLSCPESLTCDLSGMDSFCQDLPLQFETEYPQVLTYPGCYNDSTFESCNQSECISCIGADSHFVPRLISAVPMQGGQLPFPALPCCPIPPQPKTAPSLCRLTSTHAYNPRKDGNGNGFGIPPWFNHIGSPFFCNFKVHPPSQDAHDLNHNDEYQHCIPYSPCCLLSGGGHGDNESPPFWDVCNLDEETQVITDSITLVEPRPLRIPRPQRGLAEDSGLAPSDPPFLGLPKGLEGPKYGLAENSGLAPSDPPFLGLSKGLEGPKCGLAGNSGLAPSDLPSQPSRIGQRDLGGSVGGGSVSQTLPRNEHPPFWDALLPTPHPKEPCPDLNPLLDPKPDVSISPYIPAAQDDPMLDSDWERHTATHSPCPSTVLDQSSSSESVTVPYRYYPKDCKGIKRKYSPTSLDLQHFQNENENDNEGDFCSDDDADEKIDATIEHQLQFEIDPQHEDARENPSQLENGVQPGDEIDSHSITSSYIGSVQNFLLEQGPYPGWEYDEAFITTEPCHIQYPLIFIPSSPEPPTSSYTPSNASSVRRNGLGHWDEWSQDSDGHLHARPQLHSPSDHPNPPELEFLPMDLNPWEDVSIEDMKAIFGEQDEEDSEVSSHPSLCEEIWTSKPQSPVQKPNPPSLRSSPHKPPLSGGAKNHPAPETTTEAEVSKQVQRVKELAHGLAPKQLRLMLKGDGNFFKKIARTANEDHLLACVLAEAKRVGIPTGIHDRPPANDPVADSNRGKGSYQPEGRTVPSRGKGSHQNIGHNSPGIANKGKGKGNNHAKGHSEDQTTPKGRGNTGKGKGKNTNVDTPPPQHAITYQVVAEGWNVMPLDDYNGTQGGVFAIEQEEDARKLAESAANAPFPVAILSPKPLGVGIGAPRPLDVEFFECRNGLKHVVTLHTYLHQLTQVEATYAKNARAVQINRPTVARTQVVYIKYTDQGASAQMKVDLQDRKPHQAKAWIQSIINAPKPIQVHDIWHVQEVGVANGIRYYTASARVPSEHVAPLLAISQPGRIQTNIPSHLRSDLSHVWLKNGSGAMTPEEVVQIIKSCPVEHLGAFELRGTWALRVANSKIDDLKKFLGRDKAPAYFIHGASNDMDANDIRETCKQIGWSVAVGVDDCRYKRGGPVWLVRAEQPPSIYGFPLNFGYERLRIQIFTAARAHTPASVAPTPAVQPPSYASWHARTRRGPNERPYKPTFKEIVQQNGPPSKKPKTIEVKGVHGLQASAPAVQFGPNPSAASADAPMIAPTSLPVHPSQRVATSTSDREARLEQQLQALQSQNAAQSQQITTLMEQISQLTAQLQSLASLHAPEDAPMEGGGDAKS